MRQHGLVVTPRGGLKTNIPLPLGRPIGLEEVPFEILVGPPVVPKAVASRARKSVRIPLPFSGISWDFASSVLRTTAAPALEVVNLSDSGVLLKARPDCQSVRKLVEARPIRLWFPARLDSPEDQVSKMAGCRLALLLFAIPRC
jgi:hypothetical protein